MTKEQVIEASCATGAVIYHSIGDYSQPADGYCRKCTMLGFSFMNTGQLERFKLWAVVKALGELGIHLDGAAVKEALELVQD